MFTFNQVGHLKYLRHCDVTSTLLRHGALSKHFCQQIYSSPATSSKIYIFKYIFHFSVELTWRYVYYLVFSPIKISLFLILHTRNLSSNHTAVFTFLGSYVFYSIPERSESLFQRRGVCQTMSESRRNHHLSARLCSNDEPLLE